MLAASSKRESSCSASLSRWDSPITSFPPVAGSRGMIDQAAGCANPTRLPVGHLEHVTKKLALAAREAAVGRPLAGHLGGILSAARPRRSAGVGHVVDGHQPQAGLTNQLVHDQASVQRHPAGTTAGVVGPTMVLKAVVLFSAAVISRRWDVLHTAGAADARRCSSVIDELMGHQPADGPDGIRPAPSAPTPDITPEVAARIMAAVEDAFKGSRRLAPTANPAQRGGQASGRGATQGWMWFRC